MISINYRFDISGINVEDLPVGGVDVLTQLVTETLNKAMVPIKQGVLDGSAFKKKTGIRSTGKLRGQP